MRIPIHPLIVLRGIGTLHMGLGRCLENLFRDRLGITVPYLTVEELVEGVKKCLDEVGFFKERAGKMESLVREAREATGNEELTVDRFKEDVARRVVDLGYPPEAAYRRVVMDWEDMIYVAEFEEDDEEDEEAEWTDEEDWEDWDEEEEW